MSDLVVIGHVTRDLIDGAERLGGAASYVSLAAARLGMTVDLVTAAPARLPLLGPLRQPAITLEIEESPSITTFELDYSQGTRRVRLLERALDLSRPRAKARFVYLGPVMGELPVAALSWYPASEVVVGLQGFLRTSDAEGNVSPLDPPDAKHFASASAVCLSEHDHPDAEDVAAALAKYVPLVAVTRGLAGVTLYDAGEVLRLPAAPAVERDPTGAGDVFAAALTVALWRGASPVDAAKEAAYAAARAVEGPGLGNLR